MEIHIVVFNPNYWIFSLGVSLNRYVEFDEEDQWIRKELDIGLLLLSIRFSVYRQKRKREA